ncbi:hypothetical protein PENSPDRAFT_439732 [Peniophora sp. CONT]|nr:hypothetical protein PENSPDRAFT_439732 [Peniophora sp. CONT]
MIRPAASRPAAPEWRKSRSRLYAPSQLAAMADEQEPWDEARLLTTLAEVLEVYIPQIEPTTDLDTERREALRHHLDQAHAILANPEAPPSRYIGQRSVSAAQARTDAADDRVRALVELAEERDELVPQGHLRQLIVGGVPPGQHSDQEDAAIARAFRGYDAPSYDDLDVEWPAADTTTLEDYCSASRLLDERTSGEDHARAVARSLHVYADPAGASWLVEVVRAMEALMYARDCVDYVGAGKKKRERTQTLHTLQYHTWLWARHPEDGHLDESELQHCDYYETERASFDVENTKVQRMRTRLTLLYDCIGPALLLDPTWTTSSCMHVSAPFLGVLKAFDRAVSEDSVLADHRRERAEVSRETLVFLVDHMVSGQELNRYIEHFFKRCPAKCTLPS